MRGDPSTPENQGRYVKFAWFNLKGLPTVGTTDYEPKQGGAFRMYGEGQFVGEYLEAFPVVKKRRKLDPFKRCVYCGRDRDTDGAAIKLSSEHVIPEFLGAGLELPDSSCPDCQHVTAVYESSIATEMFDPIRKAFSISGKKGVIERNVFPVDLGTVKTEEEFFSTVHHPTILVMPFLFPAPVFSNTPINVDKPFNFRLYNINAKRDVLEKYAVESFSTQSVDMVRFSQMIAKIAHVYAMHHFRSDPFIPTVADFVRTDYAPETPVTGHFNHVGCLWKQQTPASTNLHEIEVGKISWNGEVFHAARVCLFASLGMPSYYVAVGLPIAAQVDAEDVAAA
ncbi:hypothetical protein [Ancylobacter sp. SL191]|uniref:hypothetical protein n=1 Tax=Ancylobacter sp. SL191 TaxID=2995166 RepID=UPI002271D4EE|nr:hypothetical protein [Ancylobacter sp. SL191]WAC27871.1 hypothetical protein OU996_01980 [Ancylobacter sp. SL191]